MLVRGADTNLQNQNMNTAIDVAASSIKDYYLFQQAIELLTKKRKTNELCMTSSPAAKVVPSKRPVVLYHCIITVSLALLVFIWVNLNNKLSTIWFVCVVSVLILDYVFFLKASLTNPGYIKKTNQLNFF